MRGQLLIFVFLGIISVGVADPLSNALLPYAIGLSRLISESRINPNNVLSFHFCLWTEAGFLKDAKLDFPMLEKVLTKDDHSAEGLHLFAALEICKAACEVSNDAYVVLDKYLRCFPTKMQG